MTDLREQLEQALGATYRIDRELGGGGMSRVFLATEIGLDRQVVKCCQQLPLGGGIADRGHLELQGGQRTPGLQHADQMGANAIVGMRYDANDVMDGVTEVLAYGTAVIMDRA